MGIFEKPAAREVVDPPFCLLIYCELLFDPGLNPHKVVDNFPRPSDETDVILSLAVKASYTTSSCFSTYTKHGDEQHCGSAEQRGNKRCLRLADRPRKYSNHR